MTCSVNVSSPLPSSHLHEPSFLMEPGSSMPLESAKLQYSLPSTISASSQTSRISNSSETLVVSALPGYNHSLVMTTSTGSGELVISQRFSTPPAISVQ